jgi:hypothetical protein
MNAELAQPTQSTLLTCDQLLPPQAIAVASQSYAQAPTGSGDAYSLVVDSLGQQYNTQVPVIKLNFSL